MKNLIEISGNLFSNGEYASFQVDIRLPEQDAISGDYFCRVLSQQLFSRCMNVYGVSRYQAINLAITLVRDALIGQVITGEDIDVAFEKEDEAISIRPLFYPQDESHRVPTGSYIVLRENGIKYINISYHDGILHGPYMSFWPNGNVSSEGQHKDGKRDGIWYFYNQNGTIHTMMRFQDGIEIDSTQYIYGEEKGSGLVNGDDLQDL